MKDIFIKFCKIKKNILNTYFLIILSSVVIQASAQSITITSPNGYEKWEANSTQIITWESKGIKEVKIEYSLEPSLP